MNINIIGISELKWMERVNLIQRTIISTTVDKTPLEKNGVSCIVNERVQNAVLGYNLKN